MQPVLRAMCPMPRGRGLCGSEQDLAALEEEQRWQPPGAQAPQCPALLSALIVPAACGTDWCVGTEGLTCSTTASPSYQLRAINHEDHRAEWTIWDNADNVWKQEV
jgi:hypothetical protein